MGSWERGGRGSRNLEEDVVERSMGVLCNTPVEKSVLQGTSNFRGDWERARGINDLIFLFSPISTGDPHCPNQTSNLKTQELC